MITQQERQETENVVKDLIRKNLSSKLTDLDIRSRGVAKFDVTEIFLTDIMALGYNDKSIELATDDIYELQSQMPWVTVNRIDISTRVKHTANRFPNEVESFSTMVKSFKNNTNKKTIIEEVTKVLNK